MGGRDKNVKDLMLLRGDIAETNYRLYVMKNSRKNCQIQMTNLQTANLSFVICANFAVTAKIRTTWL